MAHLAAKLTAAVALALLPGAAAADPISIVAALAPYIGGTAAAAIASAASFIAANAIAVAYAAYGIYGGIKARRDARRASARSRREYNAGLSDRFITTLRADPPRRIVYGRAITGGDIAAILTSDKEGIKEDGSTYTKPDGYKHIVVVLAAHEVQAINEVFIDGVAVGALDGSGWASGGEFGGVTTTKTQTKTIPPFGEFTFPGPVTVISAGYYLSGDGGWIDTSPTVNGSTVTNLTGESITVSVSYTYSKAVVRVEKHLGTDTQVASAYLQSVAPSEWTANDRLRGLAYIVLTLDLEESRFQGGPPGITADISGKKLYDPRGPTTAWSNNPALVIRDYLLAEEGFGIAASELDEASVISAANACDESISLDVGGSVTSGPRFTCDGPVSSDESPEAVLDQMASAMAGFAAHSGGSWVLNAGTYTAPVLALTDDNLAGAIEITQAGVSYEDLFNGVRGQMVELGRAVASDFDPYENATYIAADGEPLWRDLPLPFTNNRARARNLARILTEAARDALVVQYPATMHAWPLQIGDRVTVTSAEYAWTNKVFRVTDWQFDASSAVILTLQEDAAAIYDLADAATIDQAPNTGLPNPWAVPAVTGVTATSGSAHAKTLADGTVIPRVLVSWAQVQNAYVTDSGSIVIRWRRVDADSPWTTIETTGDATSEYLVGPLAADRLTISVQARNSLGHLGPITVIGHTVTGKTSAPSNPTGLTGSVAQGIITWTWDKPADFDWAETIARLGGTDWASASAFWAGRATTLLQPVTTTGDQTLRIKHRNTSGAESATAASFTVTVTAGDLVQGSPGDPGDPGLGSASPRLYQWASTQPSSPITTPAIAQTEYTWATGGQTVQSPLGNGWTLIGSLPANPGTPGIGLWVCEKTITAPAGTTTSQVFWDAGFVVYRLSVNGNTGDPGDPGDPGAPGIKAATPTVYRWEASIPTGPVGSSTYTWSSASFAAPSLWTLLPGSGLPGETLWGAQVQLVEAAGAPTSNIDWTGASITARGYQGTNGLPGDPGDPGDPGQAGISARRAYVLTTASSLGSGTVFSTGINSVPDPGSFGASGWTLTPSTPAVGQVLYQSDGLYNPSTDQITWATPYISALKVGSLSAITVNTGALTVNDSLTVGTTGAIKSAGATWGSNTGWWQGYDAGLYKFKYQNGLSRVEWNGSAFNVYDASGNLSISAGVVNYTFVTNKPTSLSAINSGEGTKLSGIAAGATVGADWSTNVTSKPTSLSGINSGEGTKLSGIAAGATVGADWSSNVTNKPTSLSGINATEGTKLTNIEPFATANRSDATTDTYIAAKLAKSGADTLTGPINFNAAQAILVGTVSEGTVSDGFYIGNSGIVGVKASVPTFHLDNAGNVTFAGLLTAGAAVAGSVTVSSGGSVRQGKSSYADTTAGFWLGNDAGTPKFHIGNSSAFLKWDGSALTVQNPTTTGAVAVGGTVYSTHARTFTGGVCTAQCLLNEDGRIFARVNGGAATDSGINWYAPTTPNVGVGKYAKFVKLHEFHYGSNISVPPSLTASGGQLNGAPDPQITLTKNMTQAGGSEYVYRVEIYDSAAYTNLIASGQFALEISFET